MIIRIINEDDYKDALDLSWEVFLEYESGDYTQSGIDMFYESIHDLDYLKTLTIYGAFDEDKLIGVIATRSQGSHIALFFVRKEYQGKKVGKALFLQVCKESRSGKLTVNSSRYAVDIYHHFGFVDTNIEQVSNGIIYTPMEYIFH